MAGYNFNMYMNDDETTLCKEAWDITRDNIEGVSLRNHLKVGAALLIGRRVAMAAATTNVPKGKGYSMAMSAWREEFLPTKLKDKTLVPSGYLDQCLFCAEHKKEFDEVFEKLTPIERARMGGPSGMTIRIKRLIKESQPGAAPKKDDEKKVTPKEQLSEAMNNLAGAEQRADRYEKRIAALESDIAAYEKAVDGGKVLTPSTSAEEATDLLMATFDAATVKKICDLAYKRASAKVKSQAKEKELKTKTAKKTTKPKDANNEGAAVREDEIGQSGDFA